MGTGRASNHMGAKLLIVKRRTTALYPFCASFLFNAFIIVAFLQLDEWIK